MASTLSPVRFQSAANRWPDEPSADESIHQDNLKTYRPFSSKGRSFGQRAARAFARFLSTLCIGVAATLAWQSYGDAAREIIASSFPQLAWVAPQPPPAQTAPTAVTAAAPTTPAPDLKQLEAMSLGIAAVRERLDQVAAQLAFNQQQTVGEIAKLQSAEQSILRNMSATPPQPAPALARKPAPLKPLTQAPPAR